MFSGTDLEKMRQSLLKDKEALRMSSMVFRWSVGDSKADSNAGIGYTGLMAALERMNISQPTTVIQPLSSPPPSERPVDTAPVLPPLPISEKGTLATHLPRYDSLIHPPPNSDERNSSLRRHATTSSSTPTARSIGLRHESNFRDTYASEAPTESTLLLDGFLRDTNRGKFYEANSCIMFYLLRRVMPALSASPCISSPAETTIALFIDLN
jgi:hypothetical protein